MLPSRCPNCERKLDHTGHDSPPNCPHCDAKIPPKTADHAHEKHAVARRISRTRRWHDDSDYVNETAVPPRHWLDREDDRGPDPFRIVRRELRGPANGLIWCGWIGFLILVVGGLLTAINSFLDFTHNQYADRRVIYRMAIGAAAGTLGAMYFVLMATGGSQMKRVRNRRKAITTGVMGILTLLFCTPFFPVSWFAAGFGIWALVVLNRAEVIEAFNRRKVKSAT